MTLDRETLEREVADLIREHITIGYTLGADGRCDPESIFVSTDGAAHMIVHRLTPSPMTGKVER